MAALMHSYISSIWNLEWNHGQWDFAYHCTANGLVDNLRIVNCPYRERFVHFNGGDPHGSWNVIHDSDNRPLLEVSINLSRVDRDAPETTLVFEPIPGTTSWVLLKDLEANKWTGYLVPLVDCHQIPESGYSQTMYAPHEDRSDIIRRKFKRKYDEHLEALGHGEEGDADASSWSGADSDKEVLQQMFLEAEDRRLNMG